jgi:transposase
MERWKARARRWELPTDTRGKPRVDDRRVISGIVHVLKSGARWVDAASAAIRPRAATP